MTTNDFSCVLDEDQALMHYGILRRSGRYLPMGFWR
jgi:hypothetical protein